MARPMVRDAHPWRPCLLSWLWPPPAAPQVLDSLGSTGEAAAAVFEAPPEAPEAEAAAPEEAELELELGVIPSTFQAESCLTLDPPHPS